MCHMSGVRCQVPCVTCQVSSVRCQVSCLFVVVFLDNGGEASRWMFCYQLSLPQQQFACTAALRMGIYSNALINGFFQHIFKNFLVFVFVEKISSNTLGLDATSSCWSQGPPPSPPSKKTSSSWKFIEVTHSRKSGCGRVSGVINILIKLFFFKIPDLVHKRTAVPVATRNHR